MAQKYTERVKILAFSRENRLRSFWLQHFWGVFDIISNVFI